MSVPFQGNAETQLEMHIPTSGLTRLYLLCTEGSILLSPHWQQEEKQDYFNLNLDHKQLKVQIQPWDKSCELISFTIQIGATTFQLKDFMKEEIKCNY